MIGRVGNLYTQGGQITGLLSHLAIFPVKKQKILGDNDKSQPVLRMVATAHKHTAWALLRHCREATFVISLRTRDPMLNSPRTLLPRQSKTCFQHWNFHISLFLLLSIPYFIYLFLLRVDLSNLMKATALKETCILFPRTCSKSYDAALGMTFACEMHISLCFGQALAALWTPREGRKWVETETR